MKNEGFESMATAIENKDEKKDGISALSGKPRRLDIMDEMSLLMKLLTPYPSVCFIIGYWQFVDRASWQTQPK